MRSFNPRARTGRDGQPILLTSMSVVSIHAPVRGATRLRSYFSSYRGFNPRARTGRDRFDHVSVALERQCFNPRARTGRDTIDRALLATDGFNPRARTGRDDYCADISKVSMFQSTRPYGARPVSQRQRVRARYVSIHAPVRGATRVICAVDSNGRFQSTRPYGARRSLGRNSISGGQFQSTRPYGARPELREYCIADVMFQSTRPYGARPERCATALGLR